MALGNTLRERRKQQNITVSQAAAGTRLKLQVVEALENEDYDRIPAPIYVKGFIKIYAEYLGLEPQPLINEYEADLQSPPSRAKEPSPVADKNQVPQLGRMHRSTTGEEMDFFDEKQAKKKEAPKAARASSAARLPEMKLQQLSDITIAFRNKLRKNSSKFIDRLESSLIHIHNTIKLRIKPLLKAVGPHGKRAATVAGYLLLAVLLLSTVIRCSRRSPARTIMLSESGAPLNLAINPPEPYMDEPIDP